jgi:hypothetical protein
MGLKWPSISGDTIRKRKLKEIEVKEVSLVDEPANLRRFLFFKGDSAMNMDKALKRLLTEWFDDDVEFDFAKIKLSAAVVTSLKEALPVLNKYRTDLPNDLKQVLDDLVGLKIQKSGLKWPSLFQKSGAEGDDDEGDIIRSTDSCPFPSITRHLVGED